MILCHCKAVNDRTIGALLDGDDSTASLADIGAACGAGTDCGSCIDALEDLLAARERAVALPAAS